MEKVKYPSNLNVYSFYPQVPKRPLPNIPVLTMFFTTSVTSAVRNGISTLSSAQHIKMIEVETVSFNHDLYPDIKGWFQC